MVLRAALALAGAGVLIGVPAALWSARLAAAMVENLSEEPLFPIAAAAAATLVFALASAYVPARRASRVDPVAALRAE
jgi:ABC-type antimicrobial peptide transport system permease subunit